MKNIQLLGIFFLISLPSLFSQEVILKDGKYLGKATGKLFTGFYKEYDDNRRIIAEISVTGGLLDGLSTYFYADGKKKEIRVYTLGQKNGIWITWNEAGIKTAEAGFKNGKKDGPWTIWDDNGTKRYEMFYVEGEKRGTWIIYDDKGNETSREEYK